jgi:hypothetical protein
MIYFIQKIVDYHLQIYTTRDTSTLQKMVMHVDIGTLQCTVQKNTIIVGLL